MQPTFEETLSYLYSRLPVFQHIGKAAYKADLNNTYALLTVVKNPQHSFKSIHIAGTNGKGSVSSLLASIFTSNGYKTGLYTSPHLKDFRERIRIDGQMISKQEVIDFTERMKPEIEEIQPSFFELTVAMAFDHFRQHKVDIAIIETGMGGRLDSTNVINPLLSVITNVGLDHMEFLGDTIEKIALEKAGIIKPETPVVIGEWKDSTLEIYRTVAAKNHSALHLAKPAPDNWISSCPLKGNYQKKNLATLSEAVKVIKNTTAFNLREDNILEGIRNVKDQTGLRGRWEIIQRHPLVVCDTAHNEHGLKEVMAQIKEQSYTKLHMVIGAVNDKDLGKILPLFPSEAHYYFCKPSVLRGLDAEILKTTAQKYGLEGKTYSGVSAAIEAARKNAAETDLIFIGGSTFVVAEALPDQSEA